ncbi:MAG: peptidylprolyl isomerase, partial [bacterium]
NRTGMEPPESQLDFIRNQVWEALVQEVLIQEALQEKGITASNEEIIYRIYNDPPDFLKSQESFQNEQKQFDMALYQAALNNPSYAGQWKPVENLLRYTLPREKLQQRLKASVHITEDEIKQEYLKQNQKVKVKYVLIEPKRFINENIEISEKMIADYYKQYKEEFQEEEKRRIQYVTFSTAATAEDSASIWESANDLIERAKNGEDFAELAEIYSEDPGSKDKGGDLGFFGKGAMVKPFEEAAFAANIGEIVGPVVSNFGLHVIKVEEKRIEKGEEQVKARHILLKFQASQNTINNAKDNANYFAEDAIERPFDELASEYHVEVDTTDYFTKGNGFIPGIGLNKKVSNYVFANKIGKVGNVEEYSQGYFVFRILEIQKARIKPLTEVKQIIKDKVMAEKRMAFAREFTQSLYEKIQNGLSFEEAAAQDSLEVKESDFFNRSGYVSGVGREAKFIGTAFALKQINDISKPVEATRGYYLIQLIEKNEFDSADYNSKKDLIAQQLLQRKQNQAFANWYANVKAKAKIKDDRDKYY